jgi:glycosyltransferase involved in cell wall biosynthesis
VSDTPLPENARLTGFLPPAEYRALLATSDCVVVLTRDEGCFLSGAGEALSLAKPLVTSDTSSLRRDFGEAAVYVQPEARSIAHGIQSALERREELVDNALRLRQTRRESQLETLRDLQEHVRGLQRGGA